MLRHLTAFEANKLNPLSLAVALVSVKALALVVAATGITLVLSLRISAYVVV